MELTSISNSSYEAEDVAAKSHTPCDYQLKQSSTIRAAKNPLNDTIDDSLRFGWGPVSGACLQRFNKPLCFLICAALAVFSEGFVVVGIAFGAITSIERQFGYTSSEVAMFTLAYEVAVGIMSVILGYFSNIHRPRCIAASLVILAGGAVVSAIPKFVLGTYNAAIERTTDFCFINATTVAVVGRLGEACHSVEHTYYKIIFIVGFVLMGFGAVPLWTLIPVHLEEVSGRRLSSIYMGFYYGANAIGPAVGFLVGKPILSMWVDMGEPPASLIPSNRNWVGAWWLGFFVGAGILLLPVLPLFAFPKEFPGTHLLRKKRDQAEDCAARDDTLKSDLKSVWPTFRALLTNPPYVFIMLCITSESLAVGGFSAFLAKFVHIQFHVTEGDSSLYTGAMIIPGAVAGVMIGGYLLNHYDWDTRQILKFCTVVAFVSAVCLVIVFAGCDGRRVVGQMDTGEILDGGDLSHNFSNTCNGGCGCTTQFYKPICSVEDQKTYYSPCHAGCLKNNSIIQLKTLGAHEDNRSFKNSKGSADDGEIDLDEAQFYYNCSCFPPNVTHAIRGACTDECTLLPLFAVGMVITMLLTFLNNIPLVQATLRVANAGQGSFALGFGQVFIRFLGFVPGPFMFGALIDESCELWQQDVCSKETRNCLEYNQPKFRYFMFAGGIVTKMLSFIFIFLALKTYQLPDKTRAKRSTVGKVNLTIGNDSVTHDENKIYD